MIERLINSPLRHKSNDSLLVDFVHIVFRPHDRPRGYCVDPDIRSEFLVDPDDPLNAVIVNLDRAPRNAEGFVEFSAPSLV